MGIVRKTISITDRHEQWVKAQIESGRFTNDSEYFRDLLRKDEERSHEFELTRAAIEKGLNSGVSNLDVDDIWQQAIDEHKNAEK